MSTSGADRSDSEALGRAPQVVDDESRALATLPAYGPPLAMAGGFGPAGSDILHGGFNQTWLVNCLRRRWLLALLMGLLVGSMAGLLLLWVFPETSRITSYLEVRSNSSNPLASQTQRQESPIIVKAEAMSQLTLLKSPLVLEPALQRAEIAQLDAVQNHKTDAVLWLAEELKVSFPGDSQILEVKYEGEEDPAEMVKIVDAVVKSYQDKVLFQDRLISVNTRDDMSQVLADKKADLRVLLDQFKKKAKVLGQTTEEIEIPKLSAEIQMLQKRIEEVKKELIDIEVMKQLAVLSARSPALLEQAIGAELDREPIIANYKQQIFQIQLAIQQRLAAGKQQGTAVLKRLVAQRDQMVDMMNQSRAAAEKDIRDRLAKIPNEGLRAAIIEHKVRFESAQNMLKDYETKLEDANKKLQDMGARDPELAMLESEITTQESVILELQKKIEDFNIMKQAMSKRGENSASEFERVRVMQSANALEGVNWLERLLIAGLGGLAGMALTAYGVALMEFRHRRLNGPSDIDEGLGVRVLGVLPPTSLKALTSRSLVATQVAESIDNVRATLIQSLTIKPHQVVMVSGPVTMEGTTLVACSLALSLARAGRRTLLIDADLRSPDVHKVFGLSLDDGLSEVLRSVAELDQVIQPTNHENLYVLPAGMCDGDAVRAMATDRPAEILDKLREQFDFVIIDAPPVLGVADSLTLGKHIDGVVLTVLRDHSEVPEIHKAIESLRSMGIRLIGVVVNGVPLKADRRVVRLHQAANRGPRLPALDLKE